jgi:hypothetical protein
MDLGSFLIMTGLGLLVVVFLARPLVERRAAGVTAGEHRLSALQAERDKILTMLREIEMDQAMGKIGAEDFQAQRSVLMTRGSGVLRELDALGGLRAAGAAEPVDLDAAIEAAVAARRGAAPQGGVGFCTRCGQPLQPHDRFCARCGAPALQEAGA